MPPGKPVTPGGIEWLQLPGIEWLQLPGNVHADDAAAPPCQADHSPDIGAVCRGIGAVGHPGAVGAVGVVGAIVGICASAWFMVWGVWFNVYGLGCMVQCLWFNV